MNNLSPELLEIIVSFLEPSELIFHATISRPWQFVIERHTFRSIRLKSTELEYFSTIFSGHRRVALAELNYHIILPTYRDHSCAESEEATDKNLNNQIFTTALCDLFQTLHSWDDDNSQNGRPISLTLTAYSPTDVPRRDNIEQHRHQTVVSLERIDAFGHRYRHSFLRLLRPDDLVIVSRIAHFNVLVGVEIPRRIEGASVATVAARLPRLEAINWILNDDEKKFPSIRQQHRYEFAQTLTTLTDTLPFLKSFFLDFTHTTPHNHSLSLPSALRAPSPTDHLSLALHTLSQSPNLTRLTLTGPIIVSPDLFWPSASSASPPFWPRLQYFDVTLGTTTPAGGCYYINPSNPATHPYLGLYHPLPSLTYSSENSTTPNPYTPVYDGIAPRHTRTRLSTALFNSLLLAMARAATCMPQIRRLSLLTDVQSLSAFEAQATSPAPGGCGRERGRKKWCVVVGKEMEWAVPEGLRELWETWAGEGGVSLMGL